MSSNNQKRKEAPESSQETDGGATGGIPNTTELTGEQIDELKAKALKAEEHWQRFLRATADLENSRKRAARERQEATKFANESLLSKLIPVLDSLEMALTAAETPEGVTTDSLKKGVAMVHTQLKNALVDAGLNEVDATLQPFNPNLHEAVAQETTSEVPDGHIIRQLRKGYKLNDRLIRPAAVVVAHSPSA